MDYNKAIMERNIKLLAIFNFFTDLKFHSALLILYFAHVTGSYTLAMSLFAVTTVASAVGEIPTGIFSDMVGRKRTMIFGALFATTAAVLYAVGSLYGILFIGAVFDGLSQSWYSGNNDALLYDSLTESGKKDTYTHVLGRVSAMFQVALTVGTLIGSILIHWSYAPVMWFSCIPQFLCLVIAYFIIEPKRVSKQNPNIYSHIVRSIQLLWKNKTLRLLALQDSITYSIGEATFQFRSVFIASLWPLWAVGIAKACSYVAASVSYWYSGKLIKRIGAYPILIISKIYNRIIGIGSVIIPTVVSPLLMSTTSLWYGVTNVAVNSLMQKEYSSEERATLGSVTSFIGSMMFGIFSICIGFIADKTNPAVALVVAEIGNIPAVIIAWKLFSKNHRSTVQ